MTGHSTLGPATTVAVCSGAADDATTTALFADLVCADHELLRAEFDAIITANFPDPAEGPQPPVPARAVATVTDRDPSQRRAAGYGSPRPGRGIAGTPHPQPRERAPPTGTAIGPPTASEPVETHGGDHQDSPEHRDHQ
jgi:hypothetical protein